MAIELKPGRQALYQNQAVEVLELVGHDQALITLGANGDVRRVPRAELIPIAAAEEVLAKTDVAAISKKDWEIAQKRTTAIREVLAQMTGRTGMARTKAAELGISERQFWRLLHYYERHQTVSGMTPRAAGRKLGVRVLDIEVERVIGEKIESYYLVPERPTIQALVERIATACRDKSLAPPSRGAVVRRLEAHETRDSQRRRIGSKKAKYLYQGMPGHVETSAFLERVEIDHTPLDVMACSDDPLCQYIGRPWLSIAIDVHTRCVLGLHIGFEPPSILSVALCLTHAVLQKSPASEFGVPLDWPMHGLPKEIVVDNGIDFVSAAFRRGCDEHGIILSLRPIGGPHYGGTIERLIGTMVGQCHLLPGTTKNSVKTKGEYDSAKHAALTLSQVRRWFVEQLLGRYHLREHRMLRIPPLEAWKRSLGGGDDTQPA